MNLILCDKCGSEMIPINPDHNCGMTCPKCGWGWATTDYNPMWNDDTIYDIILMPDNGCSCEIIKSLSKLTGLNSLQIKTKFMNAPVSLFSGRAEQINEIIKVLNSYSIIYKTSPEYPY